MTRPIGVKPEGGKMDRMAAQSAKIEAGHVLSPEERPVACRFPDEILSFPNGRHDDQVDRVSQFLSGFSATHIETEYCSSGLLSSVLAARNGRETDHGVFGSLVRAEALEVLRTERGSVFVSNGSYLCIEDGQLLESGRNACFRRNILRWVRRPEPTITPRATVPETSYERIHSTRLSGLISSTIQIAPEAVVGGG